MKWAVLLTAIILFIPLATAVSEVRFEVNGQTLSYVGPTETIQGHITFRASNDVSGVQFRGQAIVGGQTGVVDTSMCDGRCSVAATINPSQQVTFIARKLVEGFVEQEITLQFQIDETPPSITNFRVGQCTQACSFGPNQQNISFRVARQGSPVLNETIRVTANDNPLQTTCTAVQDAIQCTSRLTGTADLQLLITARDAAGNVAELRPSVSYDATAPRITEVVLPTNQLAGGQSARILVRVEEPLAANLLIQTSFGNFTGQCVRRGNIENQLECTADIRPPNTRISEDARIIVTDRAMNRDEEVRRLEIYESDVSVDPNFWNAQASARHKLDAYTFQVMDKSFPIDLRLSAIEETSAQPVTITAACRLAGVPVDVAPIVAKRNTRIDLTLRPMSNRDAETLAQQNITCVIRTTTRVGDTIFGAGNPEEDTITVPMQNALVRLPPPREQLRETKELLIEEQRQRQKTLTTMGRGVTGLQMACGIDKPLTQGMVSGLVVSAATAWFPIVSEPLEGAMDGIGLTLRNIQRAVKPFCFAVECNLDRHLWEGFGSGGSSAQSSSSGSGNALRETAMGAVEGLGVDISADALLDPNRSEYAALVTGCLPAYVQHQYAKLRQVCVYENCLNEMDVTGRTVRECQEDRNYVECVQQRSALYFLIPGTSILDTTLAQAETLFSNPLSIIGPASVFVCSREILPVQVARLACKLPMERENIDKFTRDSFNLYSAYQEINTLISGVNDACAVSEDYNQLLSTRIFLSGLAEHSGCRPAYTTARVDGQEFIVVNGRVYQPSAGDEQTAQIRAAQTISSTTGTLTRVSASHPAYGEVIQSYRTCQDNVREHARQVGENVFGAGTYNQLVRGYEEIDALQAEMKTLEENIISLERGGEQAQVVFLNQALQRQEEILEGVDPVTKQRILDSTRGLWGHNVNLGSPSSSSDIPVIDPVTVTVDRSAQTERQRIDSQIQTCQQAGGVRGDCIIEARLASQERMIEFYSGFGITQDQARLLGLSTEPIVMASEESTIERSVEELNDLRTQIEERKQQLERISRDAQVDYYREVELQGARAVTRESIATAMTFARIGQAAMQYGNWEPPGWWSIGSSVSGTFRQLRTGLEDHTLGQFLCTPQEQEVSRAAATSQGGTGARIAAYSASVPTEQGVRYDIIIEAFVKLPEPVNEPAKIVLRDPTVLEDDNWEFALNTTFARTGNDRIILPASERNYRRACIVFERPLRDYFPFAAYQDLSSRELCTNIQQVNQ